MKEDLESIIGDGNMVREFPEAFEKVLEVTAGMEEARTEDILIRDVETKNIMTKSNFAGGGYSQNPYVGCTHAWQVLLRFFHEKVYRTYGRVGEHFLDIKHWPEIKHPEKYAGQRVRIGSRTDGYNPQEKEFGNTRKLLEQQWGSEQIF